MRKLHLRISLTIWRVIRRVVVVALHCCYQNCTSQKSDSCKSKNTVSIPNIVFVVFSKQKFFLCVLDSHLHLAKTKKTKKAQSLHLSKKRQQQQQQISLIKCYLHLPFLSILSTDQSFAERDLLKFLELFPHPNSSVRAQNDLSRQPSDQCCCCIMNICQSKTSETINL